MSFPRFPLLAAILLALPLAPAQTAPAPAPHERVERRRVEARRAKPQPPPPSAFNGHPRLAILLVVDSLPEYALETWRDDFAKDRGFDLFLDQGAYFPDCYFDYANNEADPGHAAIATGAYTNGNGIASDYWWDLSRNQKRPVGSVEDERYRMIGLPSPNAPAAQPATAPAATPGTTAPATPGSTATPAAPSTTAQTTPASPTPPATAPANPPATAPAPQTGTTTSPNPSGTQPANAAATQATPPATPPAAPASTKYVTGASPRNLLASTLGDELRLATQGQSRVYGISLRDRAAILLSGAAASGAFWIDPKSGDWITSSFYMPQLPAWVDAFNNGDNLPQAEQQSGVQNITNFYDQVGPTPAASQYELEFAEDLIRNEQLGQRNVTDLLAISLPASNLESPGSAPGASQEQLAADSLDTQLDAFFTWLDTNIPGGLGNVWIALTSDRGVAPLSVAAAGYGLNAAHIDLPKLIANLNLAMNMKFSPGEKIAYVLPRQSLPYISLDESQFMKDGIDEQEAEQAVQKALPVAFRGLWPAGPEPLPSDSPLAGTGPHAPQPSDRRLPPHPVLFRSYTRTQLAAGLLPPTPWGRLIANSYSPNGGWYIMVIPTAYQMASAQGAPPFGPWSYNRHVPLALWGAPFQPGVYLSQVQPVDIAPTFAALLGINAPSASVGQVLTQALRPADHVEYPRVVVHHEPERPAAPAHRETVPAKPAATRLTPAAKPAAAPASAAIKPAPKPAPAKAPATPGAPQG